MAAGSPDMQGLFADPKTDIIFKKIFGQKERQHLLIELLTSLLELDEAHRIVGLEYLSPEQLPSRPAGKLSILDVKCTDARGVRYVIEMQVIEVEASRSAWSTTPARPTPTSWRRAAGLPRAQRRDRGDASATSSCSPKIIAPLGRPPQVPMLSRWRMQEQHSGAAGLARCSTCSWSCRSTAAGDRPETTVERWAYFFREAQAFDPGCPRRCRPGPYAEALQVARLANLTVAEETEYERELMAEQDVRGGLTLAERRGRAEGELVGRRWGLRLAITATCEVLDLPLGAAEEAELERRTLPELEALHAAIRRERRWPG
jgi:hypothetical protein